MAEKFFYGLKKRFWRGFFLFHDGYKHYYIRLAIVFFVLLTPLNNLLNPYFWVMSPEEYRMFGIVSSIIMGLVCIFGLIIYATIWRVLFPTYWVVGSTDNYKLGRMYWHSKGYLAKKSREIKERYGFKVEPETELTILVNQGRLLNILDPWRSLDILHLPLGSKFWRDPTEIKVWEPSVRRKLFSKNGVTEYICTDNKLLGGSVYNTDILSEVNISVDRLVGIAQKASHADVSLAKELLADSAVWIPEDIKIKIEELEGVE